MTFGVLLFAHWVGDFAVQTSNMAIHKSHSLKWLTYHCLAYTAAILLFGIFVIPMDYLPAYIGLNFALHFVTDFFTSKWAAIHKDVPRKFYPIIGLDQFIHVFTLYWTLDYLGIANLF
jgi:uncharacterized protein DUF3307